MTHSHEDRVAERPAHLCAAYGCPLIGTSTSSTTGSTDWYCFAHFGAQAGRFQAITSELNRLRWLSMAAHDVRFHQRGTAESRKAMELITHELTVHQRPDLLWNGTETRRAWLERLENELRAHLHQVLQPAQQEQLPVDQSVGTFDKVGFDMPA